MDGWIDGYIVLCSVTIANLREYTPRLIGLDKIRFGFTRRIFVGGFLVHTLATWPYSFFVLEGFVHESIIFLLYPPSCVSYTIAIQLHDYCAIYPHPPADPPCVCHSPYSIRMGNVGLRSELDYNP